MKKLNNPTIVSRVYRTVLLAGMFLTVLAGQLEADAMFEEHTIFENTNGACALAAADFNLDQHQDIVYTCFQSNHIKWLENDGNLGFTPHTVIENFLDAKAIDTGDINQDGWPDFVATAHSGNKISYFFNNGNGTFTEQVLTETWINPGWVLVTDPVSGNLIDINSDGHVDVLATACISGRLGWFENDGEGNFIEHIVKDGWTRVSGAVAVDLDNDEDTDILAAAQAGGIVWFENTGAGESFVEHLLFDEWDKANWIQAGDINNDGFLDFAATSCGNSDTIAWFENDGQQNFTCHPLRENYNGARCPVISDIDADGDMDIFGMAWQGAVASFFDNDGQENFTEYIISNDAFDLLKYYVVNLDGDGDLDLIGSTAVYGNHHLRWWENIDEFIMVDFELDQDSGHLPLTVNFSQNTYSNPVVVSWNWDFDSDGYIDSTDPDPTFIYEAVGNYNVSLNVSNGAIIEEIVKEDLVRVFDGESAVEFISDLSSISIPASPGLNLTGPFTLETWFKAYDFGFHPSFGNGMIFFKDKISVYINNGFPVYNEHSLIIKLSHADGSQSTVATPPGSIELNRGRHFAMTYDGVSELQVYINGCPQVLTVYFPIGGAVEDNTDIDLILGNNDELNSGFKGVLDEVRIWDEVRLQTEILIGMEQYLNENQPGLKAYWQINEGFGDTIFDLTPNLNDGNIGNCRWHLGTPFDLTQVTEDLIQVCPAEITNYPNPFNPETTVRFVTTQLYTQPVIKIYNLKGQKVRNLPLQHTSGEIENGLRYYSVVWDGRDERGKSLPGGVYFADFDAGGFHVSRKLLMMK